MPGQLHGAWRPLSLAAVVAGFGAVATLGLGAITGMDGSELIHLGLLLLPAVAVTALAATVASRLLATASVRQRMLAVALVGTTVGVVSLASLSRLMVVGNDDAALAIIGVYSLAAGGAAAFAVSRSSARAIERLADTADRLAEGDLSSRVGPLQADRELTELASVVDGMAERMERSLARERAGEAQRRDLITAVSHDLRTPLASLRAMVEAIADEIVDDPPTMRRYAREMRGSVDSLVTMVDDLFELVQIDAGAIAEETERIAVADAVDSAIGACTAQATDKGLELKTRLNGAGSASCSPRVARVVQNLLQNAIRHTPADGTITVEASRIPEGIELVVSDDGEGIEPQALDRVFEPFWRGDSARRTPGSGLGLALVKRIVESLGGRVAVESAPASGSRFAVLIPDGR